MTWVNDRLNYASRTLRTNFDGKIFLPILIEYPYPSYRILAEIYSQFRRVIDHQGVHRRLTIRQMKSDCVQR
jgi:hypothetical protein